MGKSGFCFESWRLYGCCHCQVCGAMLPSPSTSRGFASLDARSPWWLLVPSPTLVGVFWLTSVGLTDLLLLSERVADS